jgi:hypothetical protein
MKKESLSKISKRAKVDFLKKLQTGKFELAEAYTPAPKLNFDLIPESGLYLCKETGKEMTKEEIEALPGYRLNLQLVDDRAQVRGEKPPSGIMLFPYSRDEYLNSLLKNPDDKYLSRDEANQLLDHLDNGDFEKMILPK